MLTDLGFAQRFLQALFPVPLSHFEALDSGWHCQTLAFRAQEHALVLKISRHAEGLDQEVQARARWGHFLPVPAVYFSGEQPPWHWIVQARCAGESLEHHFSQSRFHAFLPALLTLHQQQPSPVTDAVSHWVQHLRFLHGFKTSELKARTPEEGLSPLCWQRYKAQLEQALEVYVAHVPENVVGAIHGDLKPAHVFVAGQNLTGVIDWEMQGTGDFVYDWACFLFFADPELSSTTLLETFARPYRSQGMVLKGLSKRWQACVLHTGLGALFMLSQSGMLQDYHRYKERLEELLKLNSIAEAFE